MKSVNKKIKNAQSGIFEGIKFRSQLEIRVAKYLKENNIDFEYESIRLELIPSFKYNGQSYRAVHYKPDFKCGNFLLEVKGYPNDSWSLKKKLIITTILKNNLPYIFREVHTIKELKEVINEVRESNKQQ